jgi:septum formation protein
MEWILASASPRRKELLAELIKEFEIQPAKGEEKIEDIHPKLLVQSLATQKSKEISAMESSKGKLVLGSDTVVALAGEVLGKPKNEADAIRMLTALSGNSHHVYTGVCITLTTDEGVKCWQAADDTEVVFEELSLEQIKAYVATGSPMDKAGAYGIQDGGLVKEIKGSFSNVMGLPLELLKSILIQIGEELGESIV